MKRSETTLSFAAGVQPKMAASNASHPARRITAALARRSVADLREASREVISFFCSSRLVGSGNVRSRRAGLEMFFIVGEVPVTVVPGDLTDEEIADLA